MGCLPQALISGDLDGHLEAFDLQAGQPGVELPNHGDTVSACVVSPDGRLLATCSHDGSLKLWRLGRRGPRLLTTIVDGPEAIYYCVFAPRDRLIPAGCGRSLLPPTAPDCSPVRARVGCVIGPV